MTKTLDLDQLSQFTGSENWYRHGIVRDVIFTDGAKFVADTAGAYWLLDEIALAQKYEKAVSAETFQLWELAVIEDNKATLTCGDGNGHEVFIKRIDFTDFPSPGIKLYVRDSTVMLPSEY